MINYVNEEKFLAWYREKAKAPVERDKILSEVYANYCDTRSEVFRLPAAQSVSGAEESYGFTVDNIGCCGASTIFVYF